MVSLTLPLTSFALSLTGPGGSKAPSLGQLMGCLGGETARCRSLVWLLG